MTTARGLRPNRKPQVLPDVLARWLVQFVRVNGYAPTGADVARSFGVAPTTGRAWLSRLEEQGYIRRGKGIRNLTVNEERLVA